MMMIREVSEPTSLACAACGFLFWSDMVDGSFCEDCVEVSWIGPEEASFIRSAAMARTAAPLSDPWGMV